MNDVSLVSRSLSWFQDASASGVEVRTQAQLPERLDVGLSSAQVAAEQSLG
jgi:hypothetical protein